MSYLIENSTFKRHLATKKVKSLKYNIYETSDSIMKYNLYTNASKIIDDYR